MEMKVFFLPSVLVFFGPAWSLFTSLDKSPFTSKGFSQGYISAGITELLFDLAHALLPGTAPHTDMDTRTHTSRSSGLPMLSSTDPVGDWRCEERKFCSLFIRHRHLLRNNLFSQKTVRKLLQFIGLEVFSNSQYSFRYCGLASKAQGLHPEYLDSGASITH